MWDVWRLSYNIDKLVWGSERDESNSGLSRVYFALAQSHIWPILIKWKSPVQYRQSFLVTKILYLLDSCVVDYCQSSFSPVCVVLEEFLVWQCIPWKLWCIAFEPVTFLARTKRCSASLNGGVNDYLVLKGSWSLPTDSHIANGKAPKCRVGPLLNDKCFTSFERYSLYGSWSCH